MEIKEYFLNRLIDQKQFIEENNLKLTLAIIQIGNNAASTTYIKGKVKDGEKLGVNVIVYKYDYLDEKHLIKNIKKLNKNPKIDGIIVQLPLPNGINEEIIKLSISPKKDVDGFNPLSKTDCCTPKGILNYLTFLKYPFEGKNAVVIGRSDIVGKPMAKLLLKENMNVTILHSKTSIEDKRKYIENADLIIVATGHEHTLTKDFNFKQNAFIVDVGINKDDKGKLCGDCDLDLPVSFQSPVPGGVGLLTRITIFDNLIDLKLNKNN